MESRGAPDVPMGEAGAASDVAVQQRPWRMRRLLSSFGARAEAFLAAAAFDRGPWIAVALASGIGTWFWLQSPWQWIAALGVLVSIALLALAIWRDRHDRARIMVAAVSMAMAAALGLTLVWTKSELIGAEAISHPRMERLDARILEREEQPARERVRLVVAARDSVDGRTLKLRINVPVEKDSAGAEVGARIAFRARLMPPASPILPGAYDFARRAWFEGFAATGTLVGELEIVEPANTGEGRIARVQRALSAHVRSRLDGASGAIAATLASGDRGAIEQSDAEAMRDAGLTHLLSISGLHVSAVIAAAYFVAIKLLALWPWLLLRVRLPILAATIAAGSGIAYTLLTGAQVPTVRSCIGAILVLVALALGREPLSMRMVAVAAIGVLLLWPEALTGPSFQMSFAAVIAIVALHTADPVRKFLAPREESAMRRFLRRVFMLFVTGLVIEIALMPVVLFHFHRAGLYGAFANVFAIPLVTFVSMPLVALALVLDIAGLGAPAWWLAGQSLDLLLEIARFTSSRPNAVKLVPQMGLGTVLLFAGGALWMALWQGRARLWALAPLILASFSLLATPKPDLLVTRDGRHVGIVGADDRLLLLRDSRSSYARDNLKELAGIESEPIALANWDGARCSPDFCVATLDREGASWHLLLARSNNMIDERALAAACEKAHIVVADRYLPGSCRPLWLKADRGLLDRKGGLAVYLSEERVVAVADSQGEHGWWRGKPR